MLSLLSLFSMPAAPTHSIPEVPKSALADSVKPTPCASSHASRSQPSTNPYFPPLPDEIDHSIFRIAAASDADTCRALCLVSSWVRLMVLPFRIPTVVVRHTDHWLLDFARRFPRKDWVCPAHFIRHLRLHHQIRLSDIDRVSSVPLRALNLDYHSLFSLCPRVTNLSAPSSVFRTIVHQGALQLLRAGPITTLTVQNMSSAELITYRDPAVRAMYANVQDLTVPLWTSGPADLSAFRSMTHLSLSLCRTSSEAAWSAIFQDLRGYTQLRTIDVGLPAPLAALAGKASHLVDRVERARISDPRLTSEPTSSEVLCSIPRWREKASE